MPRKKTTPAAENQPEQTTEEVQQPRERLQLFVGVDFRKLGATEETRVEAGFVDLGVLPPAFEQSLLERGLARVRMF